jgi:signal transduction histidine kinase
MSRGGWANPAPRGWWSAAAIGVCIAALYAGGRAAHDALDAGAAYFAATMAVGMAVGLWAWARRPGTRIGILMYLWPALWLAGDLPSAFPASRLPSTVGVALFVFGPIVWAQTALSYPTGRLLPGRLAWIFVFVLGYAAQVVQNVYNLLFLDNSGCPVCPPPTEPTLLHVDATPPIPVERWNDGWLVFVMAILPIGLYLLYRAYRRGSPALRRSTGPVLLTATFITCTSWVTSYAALTDRFSLLTPISWLQTTGALAAALTALIGLGATRRARGSVGDLVVALERGGPGGVRGALASTIGDPTLELALQRPGSEAWVDERGVEIELPAGADRAVTLVADGTVAMIHDPVLLDQPALLEAAGSAARFALENERLQAELRAQLAELRASRARIVRAADEERRRVERDLHDGAQQRLLGIGMALQLARSRLDGNVEAHQLVEEAEVEVRGAITELRELARGIHPAVLSDQGLDEAVRTLAERAPLPVEVDGTAEGLPSHVETAVYFVVSEALVNVAKHAGASRARVGIDRVGATLQVEISDDGVGGATADGGSGLRGLADRVGALDGTLRIESPAGGGTRLHVELPCGS